MPTTNKIIVFDGDTMIEYGSGAKCEEISSFIKTNQTILFGIPLISIKESQSFSTQLLKSLLSFQNVTIQNKEQQKEAQYRDCDDNESSQVSSYAEFLLNKFSAENQGTNYQVFVVTENQAIRKRCVEKNSGLFHGDTDDLQVFVTGNGRISEIKENVVYKKVFKSVWILTGAEIEELSFSSLDNLFYQIVQITLKGLIEYQISLNMGQIMKNLQNMQNGVENLVGNKVENKVENTNSMEAGFKSWGQITNSTENCNGMENTETDSQQKSSNFQRNNSNESNPVNLVEILPRLNSMTPRDLADLLIREWDNIFGIIPNSAERKFEPAWKSLKWLITQFGSKNAGFNPLKSQNNSNTIDYRTFKILVGCRNLVIFEVFFSEFFGLRFDFFKIAFLAPSSSSFYEAIKIFIQKTGRHF